MLSWFIRYDVTRHYNFLGRRLVCKIVLYIFGTLEWGFESIKRGWVKLFVKKNGVPTLFLAVFWGLLID